MGGLIFRAFPCEVELNYITVSRLLIVMWQMFVKALRTGVS